MSKVRLCAEILPTGLQCRQIALKDKPWCHSHAGTAGRERNADGRQLVGMIANMDVFSVALVLANTVDELRGRQIPPGHAQAIFDAAAARLDQLLHPRSVPQPPPGPAIRDNNSPENKRLHFVPMK